jgi:hypothetical protein
MGLDDFAAALSNHTITGNAYSKFLGHENS